MLVLLSVLSQKDGANNVADEDVDAGHDDPPDNGGFASVGERTVTDDADAISSSGTSICSNRLLATASVSLYCGL